MAEPNSEAEQSATASDPTPTAEVEPAVHESGAGERTTSGREVPGPRSSSADQSESVAGATPPAEPPASSGTETETETEIATTVIAPPAEPQPVLEPAEPDVVEAPRKEGNRLVGTAWVLLAAGLFQVIYFALLAALIAVLASTQGAGAQLGQVVAAQLQQYFVTPFAWLPVLFFFLLFELTVLIFNRAGRFLYVVASLIVGILTYVVSVLLISILVRGSIGDSATLEQTFLIPQFILIGLVSREVMLWTGVAIGARGKRVRRRNRARRDAYRAEVGGGATA